MAFDVVFDRHIIIYSDVFEDGFKPACYYYILYINILKLLFGDRLDTLFNPNIFSVI